DTKNQMVYLVVGNKTKAPLTHVLALTRIENDRRLTEKTRNMEMATRVLFAGAAGASDKNIHAAKIGIELQHILMNLERCGVYYTPKIPAGGIVAFPLTNSKDMSYVKNTEISLYADQLTVPSLRTGTLGGSLLDAPATPLKLDKKGFAQLKFAFAQKDP